LGKSVSTLSYFHFQIGFFAENICPLQKSV
jgi:hypothetical protein